MVGFRSLKSVATLSTYSSSAQNTPILYSFHLQRVLFSSGIVVYQGKFASPTWDSWQRCRSVKDSWKERPRNAISCPRKKRGFCHLDLHTCKKEMSCKIFVTQLLKKSRFSVSVPTQDLALKKNDVWSQHRFA